MILFCFVWGYVYLGGIFIVCGKFFLVREEVVNIEIEVEIEDEEKGCW